MACKDEPHNCDYFSLGKDSLAFVNAYTGKEWNKAIHNGPTLPLVLTWYCHVIQNSKMAAEVFLRMTSYIKNSRWRPDLLKECISIDGFHSDVIKL